MLPAFLIGLREGLEAALVVGILLAYLRRLDRRDVAPRLWLGVSAAIVLSLAIGALLTFGSYALTFEAMEIIGGSMSLLAVALVTWMIFWMQKAGRSLKKSLEGEIDRALTADGSRALWGIVVIGFVSVAREGIETTLLLWSMVQSFGQAPLALLGALLGIAAAVALGWLIARGMLRLDLRVFFTWTGAILIVVAAGVLAYGIHDLQEARVLPGPFAAGGVGFPFGWAFDVTGAIAPGSPLAAILQATVGFMPQMTWLQVIGWVAYVVIVGTIFLLKALSHRPPRTLGAVSGVIPAESQPASPTYQGAS